MSLPLPPRNEDVSDNNARSSNNNHRNGEQPAIFLLSGNVFKDLICSFLLPEELVELLKVSELPFLLGDRFCRTHGTTLDVSNNEHQNNNDIGFLIWFLEQQAFFAKEENEELPSTNPECIDCRKARFEGLKKCKRCDDFVHFEHIFFCSGACQRESCSDCHEGKWQCSVCENGGKYYCEDCFFGNNDRCWCEGCHEGYCRTCRMVVSCDVCGYSLCEHCSPMADRLTFNECSKTYCLQCRDSHYCDICNQAFCNDCRPGFWCEVCDRDYCREGHDMKAHTCCQCTRTVCSGCNDTFECQKCLKHYCMDCRFSFSCGQCKGEFCENCQQSNYCELCSSSFCQSCKDGFYSDFDWACIDCIRKQQGLLDLLKSKRNELNGDECANCFLSEDDMEGVKLKSCSNCKTKYCSRACQKAHWKEHRDHCHSVSKDNNET